MLRPPPTSTLFPYTTLFRSENGRFSNIGIGALLHKQRTTQDGTVYRNQGKKNTQRGIKRRSKLLYNHLHQLYHRSNHRNKHDETQKAQIHRSEILTQPTQSTGRQHIVLQQIVHRNGNGQHKNNSHPQSERSLHRFGYRQEGTHTQKVGKDHVIDEDGLKDRKSTRLNSSHVRISYAVFCLKKKK